MSTDDQLTDKTLRVLLVEDSADDAFFLERHIRRCGYSLDVSRVETVEAMQRALDEPTDWDVILADYQLPSFSAPAALALLKSTGRDIPFIMMSGAVDEETAVAAMRAGAHDYIAKQNLARLIPALEREMKEAATRRQRQETEAALRLSEERFHQLVESMPLALLISDRKGRIIYANDGVEKLLGYPRLEIEQGALTLDRLLAPGPNSPETLLQRWTQGQEEPLEIECLTHSGTTVSVLLGAAVLNPEAPPEQWQVAAFLADLSAQRRSDEVLRRTEKLTAAGRLAASIAHEINNPLEAVMNCMYLLNQGPLEETARQYLTLAQRELDRVVYITTQTLRFYRQSTRPVETNVHELFETVLALHEAKIRSLSITVVRQYGKIVPILAYDGEIRQVLANLVGNAIDAMTPMDSGRVIIRTSPARDWKSGRDGIAITVADTGSGMDETTVARIFEPFFSTKGITGTGLGLWVSLELIEKHQGTIRVRSRRGANCGTIFRIFLPSRPQQTETSEPPMLRASA